MIENIFLLLGVGARSALLADVVFWFIALGAFGTTVAHYFHDHNKKNMVHKLRAEPVEEVTASQFLMLLVMAGIMGLFWWAWPAIALALKGIKLYDKIKIWRSNQKAID